MSSRIVQRLWLILVACVGLVAGWAAAPPLYELALHLGALPAFIVGAWCGIAAGMVIGYRLHR